MLIGGDASLYQDPMAKFREELQRRGWTAQNLQIDFRFATDLKQMNSSLTELVELAPDALFTNNTPTALAMREKTKTTPIVFAIVTDPVGSGLLSNLAHPGGNVTGFTNYEFSTKLAENGWNCSRRSRPVWPGPRSYSIQRQRPIRASILVHFRMLPRLCGWS
jgi:ABC transporter substrate binding protein